MQFRPAVANHDAMRHYATQRLLLVIPVMLGVTAIVFAILHLTPGDPLRILAGDRVPEEQLEQLRVELGLDRPIPVQYIYWLGDVLRGDLGDSLALKRPVAQIISERLPFTLRLSLSSMVFSLALGIPLGLLAAVWHNRWPDHLSSNLSVFWFSMPSFWLGLMFILAFGIRLGWAPISGYDGPRALVLPVLTLGLPQMGALMRLVRAEVLEVLGSEYITFAHSKGLTLQLVYFRHVLRNALIPITALLFLSLPWLLGGAVIVETIFGWPGMGRLMVDSLFKKDFPVIQGLVLFFALGTVLSNLLGDLVSARLDPRIAMER